MSHVLSCQEFHIYHMQRTSCDIVILMFTYFDAGIAFRLKWQISFVIHELDTLSES